MHFFLSIFPLLITQYSPHVLAEKKLLCLNFDPKLTLWIVLFFLVLNRTQSVRFQSVLSSQLCASTGALPGTALAPVLFTLYTNDCRGTDITPVIKYSDDSAIEDLSNSDDVYFSAVRRLYTWCKQNFLNLNALKTKEMLIDFGKNPPPVPYLEIDDKIVERVEVQSQTAFLFLIKMLTPSTENANLDYTSCTSWETLAWTLRFCNAL